MRLADAPVTWRAEGRSNLGDKRSERTMSSGCGVKGFHFQVQLRTCSSRIRHPPTSQILSTPSLPPMPKLLFPYKPKPKPKLRTTALRCFSALTPELKSTLDKVITSNKVVLFMKGTKEFPQCGFSNTVVQILKSLNAPFETINVLDNDLLRQALKEYSNWPTFPQLYLDGEFFGGCDITVEAYQSGELQELLEKTMCS